MTDQKTQELACRLPLALENYCIEKSSAGPEVFEELKRFTEETQDLPQMLTGAVEAGFLAFLVRAFRAKSVLEIGTFTGNSALWMACALPEGGHLTTLDLNPESVEAAKSFWKKAKCDTKITPILGPALTSLENLQGPFQLIFIDADKGNYLNYLKRSLELLDPHGVIVVDNCLWSQKVLEKRPQDKPTQAIKEVNDWIAGNDNIGKCLLPIRDGLFLIHKK